MSEESGQENKHNGYVFQLNITSQQKCVINKFFKFQINYMAGCDDFCFKGCSSQIFNQLFYVALISVQYRKNDFV